MQLLITNGGAVRCLYSQEIDLAALGSPTITRAPCVGSDQRGRWLADLSRGGGPKRGPFRRRSEALAAEQGWLEAHWLAGGV